MLHPGESKEEAAEPSRHISQEEYIGILDSRRHDLVVEKGVGEEKRANARDQEYPSEMPFGQAQNRPQYEKGEHQRADAKRKAAEGRFEKIQGIHEASGLAGLVHSQGSLER